MAASVQSALTPTPNFQAPAPTWAGFWPQLGCRSVPVWRAFSGSRCRGAGESTAAKSHAQTRCFFFWFLCCCCFLSLSFFKRELGRLPAPAAKNLQGFFRRLWLAPRLPPPGLSFPPLTPPGLPARSLQLPPGCRKSSSDLLEDLQPSLFREDLAAPFEV